METEPTLAALRSEFIEKIGLISQGDGMPRIAGRIMGLMVFDGRAFSFSELAEELRVSRGSISSNARLLEDRGVLERVAMPGDRQDYFRLAADPYATVLRIVAERTRKASASIRKTTNALPQGNAAIRNRLQDYSGFYEALTEAVVQAAEKVKE